MSQKRQKFKIIPPAKNKRKKKQEDQFIVEDSDISEEQSVKPRRLQKLKKLKKDIDEQDFIPQEKESENEFVDDEELSSEEEYKNKGKKNDIKQNKGKQLNKNKKEVQLSLFSMFQSSKSKRKQKPVEGKVTKYENLNNGKNQDEAFEEAIKQSLLMDIEQDNIKQKPKQLQDYKYEMKEEVKQEKKKFNDKVGESKQKKVRKTKSKEKETSKKKNKIAKEGPFSGQTIVLTGQFEPYSKMQIIQLLQELGANCPKSLTKKATFLLQGSFVVDTWKRKIADNAKQTGKSREAEERGVKIIANEDLDLFFIQFTEKTLEQCMSKGNNIQRISENMSEKTEKVEQMQMQEKGIMGETWIKKHKPQNLSEVIGEQGQIKSLREWLLSWQDIHINGNKRDVPSSFNAFKPTGSINSKAALISGDPGIGKTTTARLLAVQFHYQIVQFNASDVRNKKSINLLENKNNMGLNSGKTLSKTLLIMDEVDGMSSGDRGGITAIISMIKQSKIPIICICNDRDSQKIKSLGGHCLDVKFHKPDKRMVVKRLAKIIQKQGGKSTDKGLQRIVEIFQNDMRQILTYLQIFFRTVSKNVVYDTVDKHQPSSKDISVLMNHFEASKKLLNRSMFNTLNIRERVNIAFVDSDFVPLMCHENYLSSAKKKGNKLEDFQKIVKATQGFVNGDLINKKIRKNQNWVLMPHLMFNQCVYPTEMVSESLGFAKFTNWLGKNSSERKTKRLIKQLKNILGKSTFVSWKSVKYQYSSIIYQRIYEKLKNQNIEEIVEFMEFYNLTPTHISEHLQSLQFGERQDLLKNIPAPLKTKLTKTYNKHHENTKFKKKKLKVAQDHSKFDPVLGEFENLKIDDDDQDEEMENEDIIERKGKNKKKK